jgi:hypothetical protein
MGTDINGPPQAPPSTHGVSFPQKEMGLNGDFTPGSEQSIPQGHYAAKTTYAHAWESIEGDYLRTDLN